MKKVIINKLFNCFQSRMYDEVKIGELVVAVIVAEVGVIVSQGPVGRNREHVQSPAGQALPLNVHDPARHPPIQP